MIIMCGLFLSLTAGEISAYVMPLEQILARVGKRFAGQYSLIIEQATHVIQSRDPLVEQVFREKVWLKNPQYERTMEMNTLAAANAKVGVQKSIPGNTTENQASESQPDPAFRQPNRDTSYRWLLMNQAKGGISAYLSRLESRYGIWGMTDVTALWRTVWATGTHKRQGSWWTRNDFSRCFSPTHFQGTRREDW